MCDFYTGILRPKGLQTVLIQRCTLLYRVGKIGHITPPPPKKKE